ncbi:hypothetical protein [Shimia sp. SDUM112013]|uniref:hypothetical protein n=1 Tax=Shimia sp. SDUM112013 TaxID=3136160 RepID=UPI0032F0899C
MVIFVGFTQSFLDSAGDDILGAREYGPATPDTITASAGNDLLFGDVLAGYLFRHTNYNGFLNALALDSGQSWSTGPEPDVGDDTVPHTRVFSTGLDDDQYFTVTVGAGETITIDIDHAYSPIGGGSFDSRVHLYDATQTEVATNNDALATLGGLGSEEVSNGLSRDSYLTYTNTGATQLFYVRVTDVTGSGVASGDTYVMSVSVTGHEALAT